MHQVVALRTSLASIQEPNPRALEASSLLLVWFWTVVFSIVIGLASFMPMSAMGLDLVPWEESREPAPAPPTAPPQHEAEDRDEEFEILDRRVISEEVVKETTVPSEAARSAPGTARNAPAAWTNDRPSPGLFGSVGLPHMGTARVGMPNTLRLGVTGEIFRARDFLEPNDDASRHAVTFAASYTPLAWLEVHGGTSFISTANSRGSPRLMQVQGDVSLGAKAVWSVARGLTLGGDLGLAFFPKIGTTGIGAAGFSPRALSTLDFRELVQDIPLLAHIEMGFLFDGTGHLPEDLSLTLAEEFALGIHHYHRFTMGVGLELPLPIATPFFAWRMRSPIGEVIVPAVLQPDGSVSSLTYGEVVSNIVTMGARITAIRDVSFLAAMDLGLTGAAVKGIPATMPWNFLLGISYVFDVGGSAEDVTRVVERVIEVDRAVPPPPVTGRIAGTIIDAHTNEPLDGVLIAVPLHDTPPVASNREGVFLSHEVPPGEVDLSFERVGYTPLTQRSAVTAGETSKVAIALERAVEPGTLVLSVVGGEPQQPVRAEVRVHGPESKDLSTDDDGNLEVELTPGNYVLNISAEGLLTRQRNVQVEEAARILLDLELTKEPDEALVTMGEGKLELSRQIHFQTGRAQILPDSHQILDQVMDLIARHDIDRIRVEGHTDNQGSRAANMRLSNERANAVRDYLIRQGISEDRIEAEGFGPDRPIAPNMTQRGRAMNRRVEFHIVGYEVDEQ